jgi:hypothetical protein
LAANSQRIVSGRRWSAAAALVATGLALFAAGCSGDDDEEAAPNRPPQNRPAQGRVPPKLVESTDVEGGQTREREVLEDVLDGMEKTTLTEIEIGRTAGRRETDEGAAVPIEFTPVRGRTVRRQWDQWIVAGAFSRRLQAADLPAEVDGSDPDGGFTAVPRQGGTPDPRPLSEDREATVVRAIRNAARRSGADDVRLEVHRPYGVAIALSVRAEDPARFLKTKLRPLMQRLDTHRPQLEGLYIAVLDERRRLVLEWGSWTRNPAGSYWVRRDLANCSPIRQSEPPGTKPPPRCPV